MQPTLSVLFAVALAETVVLGQGITWHTNPANGNRYAITPAMPWHQALQVATNAGGSLATVRNVAEHDWLINTFCTQMTQDSRVWIGLNDEAQEGSWVWSSGEAVPYRNWGLWEPDNSGNQDHAALWLIPSTFAGGWRWCDDQGGNTHPAIVEVRLPAATYASLGRYSGETSRGATVF